MVVLDELADDDVQVLLAENDEVVEGFLLQRLQKALDVGVRIGRAVGRLANRDVGVLELLVERVGELRVAIVHDDFNAETSFGGML